jgi:hypothetical protein
MVTAVLTTNVNLILCLATLESNRLADLTPDDKFTITRGGIEYTAQTNMVGFGTVTGALNAALSANPNGNYYFCTIRAGVGQSTTGIASTSFYISKPWFGELGNL